MRAAGRRMWNRIMDAGTPPRGNPGGAGEDWGRADAGTVRGQLSERGAAAVAASTGHDAALRLRPESRYVPTMAALLAVCGAFGACGGVAESAGPGSYTVRGEKSAVASEACRSYRERLEGGSKTARRRSESGWVIGCGASEEEAHRDLNRELGYALAVVVTESTMEKAKVRYSDPEREEWRSRFERLSRKVTEREWLHVWLRSPITCRVAGGPRFERVVAKGICAEAQQQLARTRAMAVYGKDESDSAIVRALLDDSRFWEVGMTLGYFPVEGRLRPDGQNEGMKMFIASDSKPKKEQVKDRRGRVPPGFQYEAEYRGQLILEFRQQNGAFGRFSWPIWRTDMQWIKAVGPSRKKARGLLWRKVVRRISEMMEERYKRFLGRIQGYIQLLEESCGDCVIPAGPDLRGAAAW